MSYTLLAGISKNGLTLPVLHPGLFGFIARKTNKQILVLPSTQWNLVRRRLDATFVVVDRFPPKFQSVDMRDSFSDAVRFAMTGNADVFVHGFHEALQDERCGRVMLHHSDGFISGDEFPLTALSDRFKTIPSTELDASLWRPQSVRTQIALQQRFV